MTLVAAGFPRGKQPEFLWEKSQWDNTVVNIKKNKKNYCCALLTGGMHNALCLGAILLQLAFTRECTPNFPWEKSQWDYTVVNIKKN